MNSAEETEEDDGDRTICNVHRINQRKGKKGDFMAVVKVYHEPGHALVRVHDDYIQPPEVREQLLMNLGRITYDILWRREEKRILEEQAAEEKEENCKDAAEKGAKDEDVNWD